MARSHHSWRLWWVLLSLLTLILFGLVGCGRGMPKTYPVKGKVVFKGGKPVRGGLIEFQSKSDPKVRATGEIQSDGTFSLTTYLEGKQAAGAVEGQHGVIVEPLAAKEGEPPIVLPQPYMVEPRDNEITIEISRPRP